jgi:hypothetical protein
MRELTYARRLDRPLLAITLAAHRADPPDVLAELQILPFEPGNAMHAVEIVGAAVGSGPIARSRLLSHIRHDAPERQTAESFLASSWLVPILTVSSSPTPPSLGTLWQPSTSVSTVCLARRQGGRIRDGREAHGGRPVGVRAHPLLIPGQGESAEPTPHGASAPL